MAVGLAVTNAQQWTVDSAQQLPAKSDLEAVMLELGRTVQYTGVVQCPLLVVVIDRRPLGTAERGRQRPVSRPMAHFQTVHCAHTLPDKFSRQTLTG